jgi:hypothetical protein
LSLGIPSQERSWTGEEIAQLGTDTDAKVGKRIGRSPAVCAIKRLELGIPPREPGWTDEEIALLGTDTDVAVAARISRTERACKLKRFRLGLTRHLKD